MKSNKIMYEAEKSPPNKRGNAPYKESNSELIQNFRIIINITHIWSRAVQRQMIF